MNSEIIGAEKAGAPISSKAPVISFFNISFALCGRSRHGRLRDGESIEDSTRERSRTFTPEGTGS
ncbi:hypothetical protein N8622_00540 [bacterium]|nr:hypothetical protein [bacterium]